MYVDSSPAPRRTPETSRRRPVHRKARQTARRTRVDDAIVSQWLLEQLPREHRHALGGQGGPAGGP
jgi:hypothetical protein